MRGPARGALFVVPKPTRAADQLRLRERSNPNVFSLAERKHKLN